jgi:hypothetical protein
MKRLLLLLVMVMLLAPAYTQAKGSSYPRTAPIPIAVSMVSAAPLLAREVQRHATGDCSGACQSRIFRRAKASFQ